MSRTTIYGRPGCTACALAGDLLPKARGRLVEELIDDLGPDEGPEVMVAARGTLPIILVQADEPGGPWLALSVARSYAAVRCEGGACAIPQRPAKGGD